jgi:hypothetical protein
MKQPSYVAYAFAQILSELPPLDFRRALMPALTLLFCLAVIWMVFAL